MSVNLKASKQYKSDFTRCQESKTDFVKCQENCEILIDYIWEKLNTGYWKHVPVAWRYAYTVVSMLKMFAETNLLLDGDSKVKFSDVMKTCDMGLLMGAPLLDNILAKMSACISPLNPDCNNVTRMAPSADIDISPKRQKLSHATHQLAQDPLCSLDETKLIQRVSCLSLESFQSKFLNTRVPVIITDAIDFWPAMSNRKWTLDYIKSVAGTRTVPIEIGSKYTEDSWSQTLMTIKEFIEKYIEHPHENNSNPKGYLAQHQLFDQIPELQNDISVPTYCCLGTRDDVDVNAWFGPRGTVSPLHYDDKDNLLAQVMGSKYIRLYSDEFTPSVYPHPHRLLHNTSQIDVEQPNYDQFPKFKSASYTECILNPGEMLFIPSKFWHFVKSLSVSFSVSFWWQ
ncbi:hypothetical protein LOTGIDRAFT_142327 [Lottia gigantea]|uniref:JmjC domain-containing protein 5 n=1 Tax=Lottia gigantea TaxID=225164 RepID=V4APD7_LOTGI|nr:hypothetical protein LOTGIDRAFT_142327 [Lottia gigantea]ESO99062.1 hypothetical protein LOTGIDRAFT_142327 [Lottia gigantea]